MQILVQHPLRGDANLVVGFLVQQLVECLFARVNARKIQVHCIKYLVIGNTILNDVILLVRQTLAARCNKVQPFAIVRFKYLMRTIHTVVIQLIDIEYRSIAPPQKPFTIPLRLRAYGRKVETDTKIQARAGM